MIEPAARPAAQSPAGPRPWHIPMTGRDPAEEHRASTPLVAAGVQGAFTSLDLRVGIVGYIVMRIALVGQWLRAASEDPVHRRTALRFAAAIAIIQVGWVLRLAVPDPIGLALIVVLGLVELSIPIWAERAGPATPWNAEHVTERYGLFTIIVIGECLLSATTAIQAATEDGGLTGSLVAIAGGGLLLVFGLWWSYFKDSAALRPDVGLLTAISWGYGHYVIFAAVAAIGVGLQIAIESTRVEGALGPVAVAATVAIPVLAYFVAASVLHGRADPGRAMRLMAALVVATLVTTGSAAVIGVPLAVLAMGAIVASTIVWHVLRGLRQPAAAERSPEPVIAV